MLIQIKKNDGQFIEGFSQKGGFKVKYRTNDLVYEFENNSFLFLLDTTLDKSRVAEVEAKLASLETIIPKQVGGLFNEAYFLVVIDKEKDTIHLLRDVAGIKTGYYTFIEDDLYIGTLVHELAKLKSAVQFSKEAVHQLLYANYLLDGYTYYEEIFEIKAGVHQQYNAGLIQIYYNKITINFQKENQLTTEENIKQLRREIQEAHKGFLAPKNTVLLSGGLDSIAMSIALDDLPTAKEVSNISFRVKDTIQDETVYATDAAKQLDQPLTIKEIAARDAANFKDFEQRFLQMNNPYYGVWIFGNLEGQLNEMYYAGQDTRLHTPALNEVDKIAFGLLKSQNSFWLKWLLRPLLHFGRMIFKLLGWQDSNNRLLRNGWKILHVAATKAYINQFHLKLNEDKISKKGLPTAYYASFKKHFDFDLTKIKTKRALYNKIIEKKWKEQYLFDIRYMQDVARLNNTYMAMPFYHPKLASFSSSIPFNLATKKMIGRSRFGKKKAIIYKYVLRNAFRDKLSDTCFYRAKAVSQTFHQLNNGIMGQKIKVILNRDLKQEQSFIKTFQLENYVQRYLTTQTWGLAADGYLGTVYYIAALCIYQYHIILRKASLVANKPFQYEKAIR